MNKRILALILTMTMILIMGVGHFTVAAQTAPNIRMESVEAERGQTVSLKVFIENNPGVWGMDIKIAYDKTALTLISVDNGNFYQTSEWTKGNLNADVYVLSYEASGFENVTTQDGTLATLNFQVSDEASTGNYVINVSYNPGDIINIDFEDIQFGVVNGMVTVKEKPVPVVGISLNKNAFSLKTGESETLTANISPDNATNKTVIWKSSDSSVAKVDAAGKVTALKEGSAVITVMTEDGSFSASCAVQVECGHTNKTETSAKNPDCVNPGNNKYYTCVDCGDVFKADGITETTAETEMLPALQHDFSEKIEDTAHQVSGSGADCQHIKKYYYDCTRCDTVGTVSWSSTAVGSHRIDTAWTTQDGEHYHKCLVAGCTYTQDKANCSGGAADCQNKAVCDVCKQPYGALTDCNFAAEKTTSEYLKSAATCKDVAVYYKSCTACGKASTETFEYGEVDGDNHTGGTELRNAVAASCTADGYTGDTYCKGCEAKLETGTDIPGGHKLTPIEYAPATHEKAGNIAHYVCSVCNKLYEGSQATVELSSEEVIIPKGEHSYSEQFQSNENGHWKSCDCGSKIEEGKHTYSEWETVIAADVGVEGKRERVCTVCGYKQTEKIPDTSSPATGDQSQLVLWGMLMTASVCGVIAALLAAQKKKKAF